MKLRHGNKNVTHHQFEPLLAVVEPESVSDWSIYHQKRIEANIQMANLVRHYFLKMTSSQDAELCFLLLTNSPCFGKLIAWWYRFSFPNCDILNKSRVREHNSAPIFKPCVQRCLQIPDKNNHQLK